MSYAELNRRINNLVAIGTVSESKSKEGLSLARVKILNRVTDFLPFMQTSNSFKTHARPVKEGEQVMVFQPFGNGDGGVILGSIYNKSQKEPAGYSDKKEVTMYMDGTVISYDADSSVMEVNAVGTINIICNSANITASQTTINGPLHVTGAISTDATISDSKGDLSNFTTTDGSGRA